MNNEEKILAILEEIKTTQDKHGEMLEQHSKTFESLNTQMEQLRADMGQMQTTLTRVAVTQENVVIPQIKLLAEGHEMLLEKLARKERVEALEDDVALLKTVVKAMAQRIEELEKAQ